MTTAQELRDLARLIEEGCLGSPVAGVALRIVRPCVDHLNCLARLHELHAMPNGEARDYGD
jgi:hypothetical protein